MTRKDYVRLADELGKLYRIIGMHGWSESYSRGERMGFEIAVGSFMDAMKRDNPNFSEQKFLEAVYKTEYETEYETA